MYRVIARRWGFAEESALCIFAAHSAVEGCTQQVDLCRRGHVVEKALLVGTAEGFDAAGVIEQGVADDADLRGAFVLIKERQEEFGLFAVIEFAEGVELVQVIGGFFAVGAQFGKPVCRVGKVFSQAVLASQAAGLHLGVDVREGGRCLDDGLADGSHVVVGAFGHAGGELFVAGSGVDEGVAFALQEGLCRASVFDEGVVFVLGDGGQEGFVEFALTGGIGLKVGVVLGEDVACEAAGVDARGLGGAHAGDAALVAAGSKGDALRVGHGGVAHADEDGVVHLRDLCGVEAELCGVIDEVLAVGLHGRGVAAIAAHEGEGAAVAAFDDAAGVDDEGRLRW